MKSKFVQTQTQKHVLRITLDRPDVLNCLNRDMAFELLDAFQQASTTVEARAVLLTANGRGFCAGQDIDELQGKKIDLGTLIDDRFNPLVRAIRYLEKPVVCAVSGIAAGAGANLALACDFVVAADNARFVQAFSKVGLIPDSGGTFFLPRLVGLARATQLMMLGDILSAEEAVRWGLIYEVVPEAQFLEVASHLAERLALMPTRALGLTKRALNSSLGNDLEAQLSLEKDLQSLAGSTSDYQEGIAAFREKRKAHFEGK